MQPPLHDRPDYKRQFRANSLDEIKALLTFARHYWFMTLIVLIGVVVLLYQARPFPPTSLVMATGQPNSSGENLGLWYQKYFAEHGIDLQLVPSNGAYANLELLKQGTVDAAFTQSGLPAPASSDLISLGSIEFQPLWFFYNGKAVDENWALDFLAHKRISIGSPNSGTQFMVRDMLREYKLTPEDYPNLVSFSGTESVEKLISGEIDAMFLLAGTESSNLQKLFHTEGLNYWNFKSARATAGRIQYADAVSFPRGAISLSPMLPEQDIELVATSATITVNKDLHPALQYLFMMATDAHYHNTENYFDRPGGFPAFLDLGFRKSPIAVKYIENHGSVFKNDLPFWLASFLDRAWLLIAALLAISLPLAKLVPQYRKYHLTLMLYDHYGDMCQLLLSIRAASTLSELSESELRLEVLADKIERTWAPAGAKEKFFFILNAMETLRTILERRREELQSNA